MSDYRLSNQRLHPEGYAKDVLRQGVKLATAYGGSPEEVTDRATLILNMFEQREGAANA